MYNVTSILYILKKIHILIIKTKLHLRSFAATLKDAFGFYTVSGSTSAKQRRPVQRKGLTMNSS